MWIVNHTKKYIFLEIYRFRKQLFVNFCVALRRISVCVCEKERESERKVKRVKSNFVDPNSNK